MKYQPEFEIGFDEFDFTVRITDYSPYRPGKYTGPWEDSYEDEPEEVEFELVDGMIYDDNGENPRMMSKEELDDAYAKHFNLIEAQVLNHIHDEQEKNREYY